MTRSHTAASPAGLRWEAPAPPRTAWAGLVAITDQGLATAGKGTLASTQTLTDLYSLPSSDFNDITSGFNGYSATPGYDLVTGLGTPKANLLVAGLLSANGVSSSVVTTSSVPAVTVTSGSTSGHKVTESVLTTTTVTNAGADGHVFRSRASRGRLADADHRRRERRVERPGHSAGFDHNDDRERERRDDHFARPERLAIAYNERPSDSG